MLSLRPTLTPFVLLLAGCLAAGGVSIAAGDASIAAGCISPSAGGVSIAAGGVSPSAGCISPSAGGISPSAGRISPSAGCASPVTVALSAAVFKNQPESAADSFGLGSLHDRLRVAGLEDRRFNQAAYLAAIEPVLDGGMIRVETLGESAEGRPISMYTFGDGPIPVLLWSQMHGDESTATMALADIYSFISDQPEHPVARAIRAGATIHTIPMLNPDGAERFQRRNAQGIDVNRDARILATPEGRILKATVNSLRPQFGFNLHDQNVRTRVGSTDRRAAIALLAPPFDETRAVNDVRRRAMEVAVAFRGAVEPMVEEHIARYDDSFNERAFGDLTTAWGIGTLLVESGGWEGDPQKQFLRKVNFVGLLSALYAIATGSHRGLDVEAYTSLPENGRSLPDLLVTGGTVVVPGLPPFRADLLVNYDDPLLQQGGVIADIGDLQGTAARDTLVADGLYLFPSEAALVRDSSSVMLQPGRPAHFTAAHNSDGSVQVWSFEGRPLAE